jgi:gluconokinase
MVLTPEKVPVEYPATLVIVSQTRLKVAEIGDIAVDDLLAWSSSGCIITTMMVGLRDAPAGGMAGQPMVIIVMGVAGSGKTVIGRRLAHVLGWDFFDADDFHSPANITRMRQGIPLTDADRAGWLEDLAGLVRSRLEQARPAVLACSALKKAYRRQLRGGASAVQFVYLKGSFAEIDRRLRRRKGHFMNAGLLDSQFATLEEPQNALTVRIHHTPDEIIRQIRETFQI